MILRGLDASAVREVGYYLEGGLPEGTEVHTVTITVNGQHGGFDVIVEGVISEGLWTEEYRRVFEMH